MWLGTFYNCIFKGFKLYYDSKYIGGGSDNALITSAFFQTCFKCFETGEI
jgi:hypothetical protein